MPFISSNQTRVIYGTNPLAAILRTVSPSVNFDMLETTTLADTAKTFQPGLEDITLNLDGLFDSTNGAGTAFDNIIAAITGESTVATSVAPSGFAVTNPVWLLGTKTISYEVSSSAPGLGVSLADLAAITATGNGTSVDNAAGTTNGGIAHLHVTDVSGTTPTLAVIIQHSTNNSTWSTLASFTSATAATSQSVAFTGTVNRYVRASYTAGGTTPSFTCQVSLARN